ncbi:MAG: YARHG domain-containing protein [Leptospira sp.]|nr:YARHG domain-containing protein [Leptospira sp.]
MKRIILILIIPIYLYSEPSEKICEEFLYDEFDSAYFLNKIEKNDLSFSHYSISNLHLAAMNDSQLRILRNFYFAKHGFIFESEDLRSYFNKRKWYVSKTKDHSLILKSLNEIEKNSIEQIKYFENNLKEPSLPNSDYIIGKWHGSYSVGSGYNERIQFFKNNTFKFYSSEMRNLPRFQYFTGNYTLTNDKLILKVTEILKYNNTEKYQIADGGNNICEWSNNQVNELIKIKKPFIFTFPVHYHNTNEEDKKGIRIGSQLFYNIEFED